MRILVVEDEDQIREVISAYLSRAGHVVSEADNGQVALDLFYEEPFDLIVLDLNLPEIDGIQVCKEIRETSNVPILMVTARTEEMDEISGLSIGADDYIKKPFSPNVLVTRVETLLRRTGNNVIEIHNLEINPHKMTVHKSGEPLQLTTTQFNIVHFLAKQPGRVFTRDEIIDQAYDEVGVKDVYDRTIDAHIKGVRKLIEDDPKEPRYIMTVIGKGYKFSDEH